MRETRAAPVAIKEGRVECWQQWGLAAPATVFETETEEMEVWRVRRLERRG